MCWYIILLPIVFGTDQLTCYYDYQLFDDKCYHLYEKPLSNYAEANYYCEEDDAELVSIHDAFANMYLRNLADEYGDNTLIGLRYYPEFDRYSWSDDSVLDYKNYAENFEEYKDYFGYCAKLVNGKWTNAECDTDRLKFICYRDAYHYELTLDNVCPNSSDFHIGGGVIVSPGYPIDFNILDNEGCIYQLVGRNQDYITIRFENINLKSGILKIYKTWDHVETNLIATANNYFVGLDVTVPHNHALLYLSSGSKGKWEISWISRDPSKTEILETECPDERALLTNFEDIISPGYPNQFAFSNDVASLGCSYKLTAAGSYFLELTFEEVSFENNQGYIEVYYGWDEKKIFVGRYSDYAQGVSIIIRGNRALVKVYGALRGTYKIKWTSLPVACKSGWEYYSATDSCYYFNQQYLNEMDAQTYCENRDCNLASVLSEDENRFVCDRTVGATWIGLIKTGHNIAGSWYWLDGSALYYTNYDAHQPDNSGACTVTNSDNGPYWDDLGCMETRRSVCKYKRSL